MKLRHKVLVLSTFCLAVSACQTKRVVAPLPIPPERMDCVVVNDRPVVPGEYVIDWSKVATVGEARAQHDAFVTRLRQRETLVAGYVVRLEGRVFACADDAQWLRDYTAALPAAQQ